MAKVKKRGNKLYVRYTVDGKEKTKATGLDDTPKNREFIKLQVIPRLLERIEEIKSSPKDTVCDLAKKYLDEKRGLKTFTEYQTRVEKHILARFGDRQISDISLEELKDWVDSFNVTPKTLKNYIADFRMIFQIAREHQFVDVNLFELIRVKRHVKKDIAPFSSSDVVKVLEESSGVLNNFFGIAFHSGMRSGEIVGLQLPDVDLESSSVRVRRAIYKGNVSSPKTDSSIREIPILNSCREYLERQIEIAKSRNSLWLFSTANGEHLYNADSLNARRFLRSIGVSNRVHDTRHTFITRMLNSGSIRITDLARIVGHSNPQMIMTVYAKWVKSEHVNIDKTINIYDERIA